MNLQAFPEPDWSQKPSTTPVDPKPTRAPGSNVIIIQLGGNYGSATVNGRTASIPYTAKLNVSYQRDDRIELRQSAAGYELPLWCRGDQGNDTISASVPTRPA
jgi:hypothetical protein